MIKMEIDNNLWIEGSVNSVPYATEFPKDIFEAFIAVLEIDVTYYYQNDNTIEG